MLAVSWGDESDSGTGSTFHFVKSTSGPLLSMEIWMVTWSPTLHSFSSNFRELATLVLSLERQRVSSPKRLKGHRCTDNDVAYKIGRRGISTSVELHRTMQLIKAVELALECRLEVIHVTGTSIIDKWTDGLSRVLWITPSSRISTKIAMDLFRPAPPSTLQLEWAVRQVESRVPPPQ
jgi:hypothetical protein